MKSHDGWVCRNAFGRGDVLCQVQCATYAKGTRMSFKTVVAKSTPTAEPRSAHVSCPKGYQLMSGGRELQFEQKKGGKTFDIRLRARSSQYESSMPK